MGLIRADAVVVGNGMIGSAAARHLAAAGLRVAAVGPGEPEDWSRHEGVFASHYDQGRITRISDPDPVWGLLAKRSIERYAEIARAGGTQFHVACGQLRVSPDPSEPGDTLEQSARVGFALGAEQERLSRAQMQERFPYLHFPAQAEGLHERGQAGFINPRALVTAQLNAAQAHGAVIVREQVTQLDRMDGACEIITSAGTRVRAPRVLLATGGFTNHILGQGLELLPKPRTAVMAELGPDELRRIGGIPTLIWRLQAHDYLKSIYSAPPVRYPDGRVCFKIGGEHLVTPYIRTPDEFRAWFQGPGDPREIAALRDVLLWLLPGLRVESWSAKPCVTTYTAHGYPYVDRIGEGVFVAVGGCGSAAKSSDEIGRMAALLVQHNAWAHDLPAGQFAARLQQA